MTKALIQALCCDILWVNHNPCCKVFSASQTGLVPDQTKWNAALLCQHNLTSLFWKNCQYCTDTSLIRGCHHCVWRSRAAAAGRGVSVPCGRLAGIVIVDEEEETCKQQGRWVTNFALLWGSVSVVQTLEGTLKGVEDGEDVVGGYEQRSMAEEGKSPGEAEQEDQTYDGERVFLDGADVLGLLFLGF